MRKTAGSLTSLLTLLLLASPLAAADVAGKLFRDKNGNGLQDTGEEGLTGSLEIFGTRDGGGMADFTVNTQSDGSFTALAPDLTNGCFAMRVNPPAGFRLGQPRQDCPGAGLAAPVGTRRYGSPRHLIDGFRANSVLHIALGDSIAEPASGCVIFAPNDQTDYIGWFQNRLKCVAPGAQTVNNAIGGKLSYDLLKPAGTCGPSNIPRGGPDRCDNIYDTIAQNPDLITISIGGNDFLGIEPTQQNEPFNQADIDKSVARLIETRKNMQEILSTLASQLPSADVILNTVYDNRAKSCASTAFHDIWVPIWNQVTRDGVWGQGDRFQVAEIHPEYAHQDLNGANCCGTQNLICNNDTILGINPPIHPDANGAKKHLEKVWDAAGGVNLGPKDGIAQTSNPGLFFPAEELVATRFPTVFADQTRGATNPSAVLARDGAGALVPAGSGEFRVSGFDAAPAGIVPTHVLVVARYRTDAPPPAAPEGDAYAFEASVDGGYLAPQMSVTGWNTIVPIVGAGANAPARNAIPSVPQFREVRALLTKNLTDDGRSTGKYTFPAITWNDIATLNVRFRGTTAGTGADSYHVEWDAAWLEVYGYRSTSPGLNVYRSTSAIGLIAPANLVGPASSSPYDDTPPAGALFYYAVDDGAGFPASIQMVKRPTGARISWP